MKQFIFYQKNSSAVITLSAPDSNEAWGELQEHVKDWHGWRCEDEDGEELY